MVTHMDIRKIASLVILVVILGVIFYPYLALGITTLRITDSGAATNVPLNAKYSQIALHRTGEGEKIGWIELLTDATGVYDLSTLKDITETVLRSRIPIGKYDKIRLRVVEVTTSINGTKINLTISQPLLTINIGLEINYGEEKILILDFKSDSTRARINRIYENSPTISILTTK